MPERIKHKPLDAEKTIRPKADIRLFKDQCKGCNYCITFCPKKVLEESDEINARGVHPPRVVNEDQCILCGFCSAVCPDFAIYVVEKKSEEKSKT